MAAHVLPLAPISIAFREASAAAALTKDERAESFAGSGVLYRISQASRRSVTEKMSAPYLITRRSLRSESKSGTSERA